MPSFKDSLLQLAYSLGFSAHEFDTVGIHAWPSVLHRIEKTFVQRFNSNTHFNWWWENFKKPYLSYCFEDGNAWKYLDQLTDSHEYVWFVACDCEHDPSKFWLFQGSIVAIQRIIREHYAFEYYIVSKKYEWLICESDHDVLYALGSAIPKLKALGQSLQ